jgi:hypothetical protein
VADALGGRVYYHPLGREIGLKTVTPPLMRIESCSYLYAKLLMR